MIRCEHSNVLKRRTDGEPLIMRKALVPLDPPCFEELPSLSRVIFARLKVSFRDRCKSYQNVRLAYDVDVIDNPLELADRALPIRLTLGDGCISGKYQVFARLRGPIIIAAGKPSRTIRKPGRTMRANAFRYVPASTSWSIIARSRRAICGRFRCRRPRPRPQLPCDA